MSLPETYTAADVARQLKKSEWWVRKQFKSGRLPGIRLSDAPNGELMFTADDVRAFLDSLRPAPLPQRTRRRRGS
jgi:hypothetical protein